MKRSFTMFFVLALTAGIWMQTANAQITVSGSNTKDGTYTSLTKAAGAFAALNGTSQAGKTIVITITADVTIEDGAIALNGVSGMWTKLTITPVGTRIISGSVAKPLIDLNGADNVTIDGRENGIGATKSLTISNTSTSATAGTSTIRFINDACTNTVKFCTIKASSGAGTTGGVINFSTTTGSTGNDGNTIDNNNITNAADASRPGYAVVSAGTSAKVNSENTISNNSIYDVFSKSAESKCIYLSANNNNWTINGNSFYETTAFADTSTDFITDCFIRIESGSGYVITSNYFGGSGAGCTGTFTKTGTGYVEFIGIYVNSTVGTTCEIQGNTIKNISWSGGVSTVTSPWTGIQVEGSIGANIGTTAGNVIGAGTGNGSVIFSRSSYFSSYGFAGIYVTSSGAAVIQNNVIGAITTNNSYTDGDTYATSLYGIRSSGSGNRTISANIIGSTDAGTSNSLYAASTSSASTNTQSVYGIYSSGTGSVNLSGNTISKLKNGATDTDGGGAVDGIFCSGSAVNTISGNTVRDLTIANNISGTANYENQGASVIGICVYSDVSGHTVSGNTVFNLSNTFTNTKATVTGIYYSGAANGINVLSGNFIRSLSFLSTTPSYAAMNGIRIGSGTLAVSNNIVLLGRDLNFIFKLYGIYENCTAGSPDFYFNTVVLYGTAGVGGQKTYCFFSGSSRPRMVKNNIFQNSRSGTTANMNAAIGVSSLTTLTIDYNDYFAPLTGGVIGTNGTTFYSTLATWRSYTLQEAHSVNNIPQFVNGIGTLPEEYRAGASALIGVSGTTILTDYAGATRSVTVPTMGAYEYNLPVTVIATLGTLSAGYQTLKEAFDAINAGTHHGVITVKINTNTTETASAVINASGSGNALYASVSVYPTASGLSVTGNLAAPLIDLNGADNVTIDGRVNATGAVKSLVITNTSISATSETSTIRFVNDACSNTVKYCTLKGSSTASSGGILYFSTTTGTTGNDDNTIGHNDITSAADANRPVNAIYSLGYIYSYGISSKENNGNTISNNNIYDFLNRGLTSKGIFLDNYTTSCTISGNSFYETQSFIPTASADYNVIYINSYLGNSFTVSNNYIGGSAANCGGTAWTKTSAFSNSLCTIYFLAGSSVESDIQGNTIKNFSIANSLNGSFTGIYAYGGSVNIGTTTGNVIGASTGNGSIFLRNATHGGAVLGIRTNGSGNINVFNNSIGSFTTANLAAFGTGTIGIIADNNTGTGTVNIVNNTIGSSSTPNSLYASSISGGATSVQNVAGIVSNASGLVVISKNLVANLTNGSTNTNLAIYGGMAYGIYTNAYGKNLITDNIVHDITIANACTNENYATVGGIYIYSSMQNTVQTISGNTVYNISNTYPNFAGTLVGVKFKDILFENISGIVSENLVYGLSVNASSLLASIVGIDIYSGSAALANNIVNLGGNSKTEVVGIYDRLPLITTDVSLLHNTVYISGSLPSGSLTKSYAVKSGRPAGRNFRNNIFVNTRSTTGGANLHYAAYFAFATNTGLTLDYNDYYVSGTGGVLGFYNNLSVTTLPLITGFDAKSLNINPNFASAGGTATLNWYPSATMNGATGTGIANDINAFPRSAARPKMGAIESASAPPKTVSVFKNGNFQASYTSIKNAFDKINDGTHTGSLGLIITASHVLNTSAVLNQSGIGSVSYTDITIYPDATDITVSGNLNAPLIDLNGAKNVTISGRDGWGSGSICLVNTSTGNNPGTCAIRFTFGASDNTVKYCTIKASTPGTGGAIVLFGSPSSVSGNSNNTLDHNNITNAGDANRPANAIYSEGNGTFQNSGNTISNNNIYDFLNRGIVSYGINIGNYSTDWTITGNSFYETASFVPTAAVGYVVINIISTTGNNFTLTNNYIGGSAASCGGTAWTKTNAFVNAFTAIYLSTATGTANSVQGNTIKNFSYANTGSSNWKGIACASSTNANIGNISGNTIGSATGTNSILFTGGATGSSFSGISITSTGTTTIQNNLIGAITAASSDGAYATNLYGISMSGSGTTTVSNNTIGSTTTAGSINATSTSTLNPQMVFGICNTGASSTATITGNTISNMRNGTTCLSNIVAGRIVGIGFSNGLNTITNNTIRDLTNANTNALLSENSSVIGISVSSPSTGQVVTGNTIYNLSNSYDAFYGYVIGIMCNGTANPSISKNFIHSLSVTGANSTAADIRGIAVLFSSLVCSNNIIILGGNTKTNLFGIWVSGSSFTETNKFYYNTVYLSGTLPSGAANKSYGLFSAGNKSTRDFRNNIFNNARSTEGGTSLHYAVYCNYSVSTKLTINYNDYYATGTGAMIGYFGADKSTLADWKTATGQDAGSLSVSPGFASAGGTAPENYFPSATLPGVVIAGITSDYAGTTRRDPPTMGAYEIVAPPSLLSANALTGFGNVCVNSTAGANSFTITGTTLTTANVTVGALTGYTYCTTSAGTYAASLDLVQPGGSYSQLIYVKFSPTLIQSYDGNIPIGGGGAAPVNVAVTGSGVQTVAITAQSTLTQSRCVNVAFSPITVTATGPGLTYQWYSNTTASTIAGTSLGSVNGAQTVSYTPQSSALGTLYYYCIVTGTWCSATSAVSEAFIVNPVTAIGSQSTAAQTQCITGTFSAITVSATGVGITYQWYKNTTAATTGGTSLFAGNGAQTASYTPQTAIAGTLYFYCIVTGTCGTATTTISGAFLVNPLTAVTSQSTAAQTRCLNVAFTPISVTAEGGGLIYQWYSNTTAANTGGNSLGSANGASTNTYTPQSSSTGTLYYYCKVQGSCGPAVYSVISGAFVVNPAPVISSQSTAAQTQCINGTFTAITVTVPGVQTFQWYSNTSAVASGGNSLGTGNGANTFSYTPQATVAGTLYYYCMVSGSCGSVTSAVSGAFTTYPVNAITSQSTAAQTACISTSFTPITVTTVGGNLVYQWYSNTSSSVVGGTSLLSANGATTSSYTPQASVAGTLYYYCKVNGSCGSEATSAISGAFITNPVAAIVSQSTVAQSVCISASYMAITVTATGSGLTYQWYKNTIASASGGTSLGTNNGANTSSYTPVAGISGTLYYYCVVHGDCGADVTSAISGAFVTKPLTAISSQSTAAQTQCYNGSFTPITVIADGASLVYQWYSNTSASATGGTSLLSANGATTNSYTPQATTVGTLYYYCIVQGSCGSDATSTVSGAFTVSPLPSAAGAITGTATVCQGDAVVVYSVTAITNATSYTWAFSGTGANITGTTNSVTLTFGANTTSGNLTVKGTNLCGDGTVSANYPIAVNTIPEISSQSTATQTRCISGSFSAITVTATATGSLTYQWYSNTTANNSGGNSLLSANGAQTYSYTPQTTNAGTLYYYCVVTGSCGTAISDVSGAFIVNTAAGISSQSTATQTQCIGGSFTPITVTAAGIGIITYQWYKNTISSNSGGTSLASANGATTNSYTPQANVAGTLYYYCIETESCGSVSSDPSEAFIVTGLPTISGVAGTTSICSGNSTVLTASSTADSPVFKWYDAASGGTLLFTGAAYTTASLTTGTTFYVDVTSGSCPTSARTATAVTVTNSPGGLGSSLSFDGTNDYVALPGTVQPSGSSFSAEAWIYLDPSGSGDQKILFNLNYSGGGKGFALNVYNDAGTGYYFKPFVYLTGTIYWSPSSAFIPASTWTHVAMTWAVNGNISAYMNGVLVGSTSTGSSTYTSSGVTTYLGIGENGVSNGFKGKIDEVRIWNTTRTQAEIQSTMNTELAGTESGLQTYYKFNQGTSGGTNAGITTLLDQTSGGKNGSLYNFALTGSSSNWVSGLPIENKSGTIVYGSSTGTMTLSGHTGTVDKWQSSADGVNWTDITNNTTTCSVTPTSVGTWKYRAQATSGACTAYSAPLSIAVTKKELTIGGSFTANNKQFDGTTNATIATNSLSLPGKVGSDAVSLDAVAVFDNASVGTGKTVSLTGSTLSGADAGNYTLSLTGAPTATADITPVSPTLGAFAAMNKTYGDPPFVIAAPTSNSPGTFSYTSSDETVATLSESTITIIKAGTSTITANQAASDPSVGYGAASTTALLTVKKADQVLTLSPLPTGGMRLDQLIGTPLLVTASSSTGLPITVSVGAGSPAIITYTGGNYYLTTTGSTGTVVVIVDQAGTVNYNPAQISNSFDVTKGNQDIAFNALPAKTYGDASFAVSATGGASGNAVTFTSSNTLIVTCDGINGATITIMGAGSCTIFADQAGNSNWNPAPTISQVLSIDKATPEITFANISKSWGDAPFTLNASSASTGTFTYTSGNTAVAILATVSSVTTATITGVGTSTLTATQYADANYNSATKDATLTVSKANQVITFNALADKIVGDPQFDLTATSTSSLAVSYASGNNPVASISGNKVTVGISGTATITASQAGDSHYNAATSFGQVQTVLTCTNPTNGGVIAAAQSGCGNYDPAAITSSSAPSGHTTGSILAYKWQKSVTGSGTGFTDIAGAESSTYDPGIIAQTTWFKRVARATCHTWTGAAESNVLEMAVTATVGGSVSGTSAIVYGSSTGTMTLGGNSGSVVKWQSSVTPYSVWTDIANTTANCTATPTSAGVWKYRAQVRDGSCDAAYSTPLSIAVSQKELTVTGIAASDKTYDGNTAVTLTGTASLSGVVSPDDVSLGGTPVAVFASRNVATAIAVSVSGYTLSGANASSYTLTQPEGLTADITAIQLTPHITASDRPYNGLTTATLSAQWVTGMITGETDVTLAVGAKSFNNANISTRTATASVLSLGGTNASNYELSSGATATDQAEITAVELTPHVTADNKPYDGSTTAVLSAQSVTGMVNGETAVTLEVTASNFDTQNTGTNKTVTSTGLTLGGAASANYVLASGAVATDQADIAAITLTPQITANDKSYDGNTTATLSAQSVTGMVNSETGVTLVVGEANFDTKNKGTNKTVTATTLSLGGANAGNYMLASGASATDLADITAVQLTPHITADNKPYDGTTTAILSSQYVTGMITGETDVTLIVGAANFSRSSIGPGKTVTATSLSLSGSQSGNYTLAPAATATSLADITVLQLTPHITANNKPYDGNKTATLSAQWVSGMIAGETDVTLNFIAANFDTRDKGTDKTVTATGLTLGGSNAGNYVLAPGATVTDLADITAIVLTPLITAIDKAYDGNTTAILSAQSVSGMITGETDVTLFVGQANFIDKDKGIGKTVTAATLTLGGADAGNYTLASAATATDLADITTVQLTPHITANDKIYDGNNTATLFAQSVSGYVSGDIVTLTVGAANFDNEDIGTDKTVTAVTLSLGGTDAGNYFLAPGATATSMANITVVQLTPYITADDKPYDGNTTVILSSQWVSGYVSGDGVNLVVGSSSFDSKNVGTDKTVTAGTLSLDGADAGNYRLALGATASDLADITAITLVSSVSADDKPYDGSTSATLSAQSVSGMVNSESVSLVVGAANFDTKDIGTDKEVTASSLSLGGSLAGNYVLASATASDQANITSVLVSPYITADDKPYDGGATATLSDQWVSGKMTGETVTLSVGAVSFAGSETGTNLLVTASTLSLGGADAGNYHLATGAIATDIADINPVQLTPHITSAAKPYDGNTTAVLTAQWVTGMVNGETEVTLEAGEANFDTRDAGTDKTVTASVLTISGAEAGNYALATDATATALADITSIEVVPHVVASNKYYDGTTAATLSSQTVSGQVQADAVDLVVGEADFDDKNIGVDIPMTAINLTLSGADAGNYSLPAGATATSQADIAAAELTVTGAVAEDKIYDGNTDAQITGATLAGVVSPDEVILGDHTTGTFTQTGAGSGISVLTKPMTISGTGISNYILIQPTSLFADIIPKTLTPHVLADNKCYDGTTTATLTSQTLTDVISPDVVTLEVEASEFDNSNTGTGKTVTASGLTLSGSEASNYTLSSTEATTAANIYPVISGNTSGSSVTICNNTATTLIGGTATGGSGSYSYLWKSSDAADGTYAAASGTNNLANYTTAVLTTSSMQVFFRRTVVSGGCTDAATGVQVTIRTGFEAGSIKTTGETLCYAGSPTEIGNETSASGGDNTITYSWRSSADSYETAISGASLSTYTPAGTLTATTSYRRYAEDNTCNKMPEVSSGTWTVTVYDNFTSGEVSTTGETICYNTSPVAAIGNTTAAIGGDNSITYSWRSSADSYAAAIDGATESTYLPSGTFTTTTSYKRYAKDNTCNTTPEVSTGTWTVTVRPAFTAGEIKSDGETICYNTSPATAIGNTTAAIGGDNAITYSWRSSTDGYAAAIDGAIESTYLPSGTLTNTISYKRYAKDNTCNTTPEVSTGTWTVTVRPQFTAGVIDSDGETICYNTSPATAIGNTTAAIGGDNAISYSWRSSADSYVAAISGATLSAYTPAGTLTSTTSYRRYAEDNTCNKIPEVSSGTWTVTVYDNFTSGEVSTTGETICYNTNPTTVIGNTTAASGGDNSITYSWRSSTDSYATTISGATLSTYTPAGTLTSTTSYRRYAKDNTCHTTPTVATGTWTVTVSADFTAGVITTTGETLCYNTIPTTAIGNTTVANGGDNSIAYSWRSSADSYVTAISGATLSTYTPAGTLTATTSYRRYAKDNTCNKIPEVSSGTWTVTVRPQFTAGAIATTGETICYNDDPAEIGCTIVASGGNASISYQWQKSTTSSLAGFSVIDLATSASYDPPTGLTANTWYRRQAKDGLCNTDLTSSTGVWKVSIETTVPAVLTKNISIYLNAAGSATLTAADIDNGSTDNCSIVAISASKTSFNCSDKGANTVILTVTDDAGNSATASSTVTVVDAINPVAVAKNITVTLNTQGTVSIAAVDIDNGSSDNCTFTLTASKATFNCSNLGPNTVILTVTDASGNTATANSVVTVVEGTDLPSPWLKTLIGNSSGTAAYSPCTVPGRYTLTSKGYTVPNNDVQEFVYQTLNGNGYIVARIVDLTNNGWAAVQIRENTTAGSKKVLLKAQLQTMIRSEVRQTQGGSHNSNQVLRQGVKWLKIVRVGNRFDTYSSENGISWRSVFSTVVSMNNQVLIGISSESMNNTTTTRARFDNVSVTASSGAKTAETEIATTGNEKQIEIYPNPARDMVTVIYPYAGIPVTLTLFSANGSAVKTTTLSNNETQVDVRSLQPGVYILRFRSAEAVNVKRLVIQ